MRGSKALSRRALLAGLLATTTTAIAQVRPGRPRGFASGFQFLGSVAPPAIAAYRDELTTGTNNAPVNGRAFKGNSYVAGLDSSHGNNGAYLVSWPRVDVTGRGVTVGGSTAGNKTHAYRVPEDAYSYFTMKVTGFGTVEIHEQVNPLSQVASASNTYAQPWAGLQFGFGSGNGQNLLINKTDGTALFSVGLLAVGQYDFGGDTLDIVTYNEGGTDWLEIRKNDRRITGTSGVFVNASYFDTTNRRINMTNLVAAGVPMSGKHGPRGASGLIDWIEGGPNTNARFLNQTFGHVANTDTTGAATWKGRVRYTNADPITANLRCDLRLASDGSAVSTGLIPTNVVVNTTAKTISYQLPVTSLPAGLFYVQLYETGLIGPDGQPNERRADSAYMAVGKVVVSQGQSNMGNSDGSTSTAAAPTLGANCWYLQSAGNSLIDGVNINPYVANAAAGTPAINSTDALYGSTAFGSAAFAYIRSAVGSTSAAQRKPGGSTGQFEMAAEVVRRHGGDVDHLRWADGESDLGNITGAGTYKQDVYDTLDGWNALVGHVVPCMMEAMGSYPVGGDVPNENVRRMQMFTMPAERPTQVIPAAFNMDGQHDTAGNVNAYRYLHYTTAAYTERARRSGRSYAKLRGTRTFDGLGPYIVSARIAAANQIAVRIHRNGADALAGSPGLTGYTAGKSDPYGGGIRFGTVTGTPSGSSGWKTITGGKIVPNAAPTFTDMGDGTTEVLYTFASAVGATVYVGGPYGEEPFNPDFLNTVGQDYANKMSAIVGTISGENSIPVRPYWQTNGNDFVTAT